MKLRVCDLCKENYPDAIIKYKYRAKRRWISWYEEQWNRIELCEDCLKKIIESEKHNAKTQ